ncbi:MAG: hypothetical protein JNM48_12550 [Rhodospirillales bacterium]|nr:hypothetical protein [Rhodospirillales bacterium]
MRIAPVLFACAASLALASCAANRVDLTESGAVDVRIDDGARSPVKYVNVYLDAEDDGTVIRGKIFGTRAPFFPRYGKHVHVVVMSPDGQVIADERPRIMWQTRSKFRSATGRFTVRLEDALPSGAVVDVVYHEGFHRNAAG